MSFTIGSLFDGSGGFPLSAFVSGGVPVWAAEVEPYPIAVTRSRFPYMKHLGSVTDIKGGEIDPVDVVSFGSPCQDVSQAGLRKGVRHVENGDEETTRSGLFFEAVRIIKEMRRATNGVYPRFAIYENVPGAFSSSKGQDFRTVLEELIKIAEPTAVMPEVPQGGWPYSDYYSGDGWSIAYRVFDSQYIRTAQRRKRIYLVLDLGSETGAREVLFERHGLRGYHQALGETWQTLAGDAEDRSRTADSETDGLTYCANFLPQKKVESIGWTTDDVSCTIHNGTCAGHQNAVVFGFDGYNSADTGDKAATLGVNCGMSTGRNGVAVPYLLKIRSGCEGGGKGALIQENKSATVSTLNDQYLFQPVGFDDYNFENTGERTCTLRAEASGGACGVTVCYDARGNGDGQTANTITGDHENRITDYTSILVEPKVFRKGTRPHSVEEGQTWEEAQTSNTLNTFDVGETRANELVVSARSIGNGQPNQITMSEVCNTLDCMHDKQAVCYGVDCRNATEYPETTGSLQAACAHNLNSNSIVRVQYIVRRLTPTECARLQGFPDFWGHPDHKDSFTDEEYEFWLNVRNTHAAINGKAVKSYTKDQMLNWYNKLHTDSSEYRMWGNGIALPCAVFVFQGIADAMNK